MSHRTILSYERLTQPMSQQSDNYFPIQFNVVGNYSSYLRESMKTMSNSGNAHFTISRNFVNYHSTSVRRKNSIPNDYNNKGFFTRLKCFWHHQVQLYLMIPESSFSLFVSSELFTKSIEFRLPQYHRTLQRNSPANDNSIHQSTYFFR
jgi:hypothetical protein